MLHEYSANGKGINVSLRFGLFIGEQTRLLVWAGKHLLGSYKK